MLTLSPKAYTAVVVVLGAFLLITAGVYIALLVWMSVNQMEATGSAFSKLELFITGNLGMFLGSIFKPASTT